MFNPYVLLAGLALFLAATVGAFFYGEHVETLAYEAAASSAKDQVLEKVQQSDDISQRISAIAVQQIDQIHAATLSQIQEVPTYVPVEVNRACTINVGFVRLFNAAAAGLPLPAATAGGIGAAASGVDLATVGTVTVTDFAAANENAARLKAVQDFYEAQRKLGN